MTKKQFATLLYKGSQLEQIKYNSNDKLVTILADAFSALATASPEDALSVIDQINLQRGEIETVLAENKEQERQAVAVLMKNMNTVIEDDSDDDNTGMMN